jgi:hypothetical protein
MGVAVVNDWPDTAVEVITKATFCRASSYSPFQPGCLFGRAKDSELKQKDVDIGPAVELTNDLELLKLRPS